ncbi:hypothetical protein GEV33_009761 [Tenebrio molitor]|uniref:Lysine-specific demethylase 3A/B tudor domain-containing protein n=1 Tax=Tenebrio molitor TaxID=7067 RepID=A0A8J6HE72_TENMO|nr:hypothetical protein GEV33_009761 [Tenebrio molitor]
MIHVFESLELELEEKFVLKEIQRKVIQLGLMEIVEEADRHEQLLDSLKFHLCNFTGICCNFHDGAQERMKLDRKDLILTDDTVLEEHNEDPALVQMRLIGDGVVESIMRGENVGITPRRSRSAVLQTQHQQQPSMAERRATAPELLPCPADCTPPQTLRSHYTQRSSVNTSFFVSRPIFQEKTAEPQSRTPPPSITRQSTHESGKCVNWLITPAIDNRRGDRRVYESFSGGGGDQTQVADVSLFCNRVSRDFAPDGESRAGLIKRYGCALAIFIHVTALESSNLSPEAHITLIDCHPTVRLIKLIIAIQSRVVRGLSVTSTSATSVNGRKQRSGKPALEVAANGGASPEPLDKERLSVLVSEERSAPTRGQLLQKRDLHYVVLTPRTKNTLVFMLND